MERPRLAAAPRLKRKIPGTRYRYDRGGEEQEAASIAHIPSLSPAKRNRYIHIVVAVRKESFQQQEGLQIVATPPTTREVRHTAFVLCMQTTTHPFILPQQKFTLNIHHV